MSEVDETDAGVGPVPRETGVRHGDDAPTTGSGHGPVASGLVQPDPESPEGGPFRAVVPMPSAERPSADTPIPEADSSLHGQPTRETPTYGGSTWHTGSVETAPAPAAPAQPPPVLPEQPGDRTAVPDGELSATDAAESSDSPTRDSSVASAGSAASADSSDSAVSADSAGSAASPEALDGTGSAEEDADDPDDAVVADGDELSDGGVELDGDDSISDDSSGDDSSSEDLTGEDEEDRSAAEGASEGAAEGSTVPPPPGLSVVQTGEDEDPPLAMEAKRAVQILNPSGEVTMPRPATPRVMCVANQKGGVGKTTTAVNIAVSLALHGNRVLVVDLDPQGNASTGLNVPHHTGVPDVYDCLVDSVPLADVAQPVEGIPNLTCVPATIDLAGAEIELVSVVARESRLARGIAAYPEPFDYVFIDCPPSLGLLTVNALVAAKEVMIPIQCEYYALEGLNQLLNNIEMVRAHLNPELAISTIVLTMYDRRTRLADAVEQDVRHHFGDKVLEAVIPRNVRVSEAPSYGQSVMTYDPGSRGSTSYFAAALEIAQRGAEQGGDA